MVFADVYGRSVLIRSIFSRFMMDKIPLHGKSVPKERRKTTFRSYSSARARREQRRTFAYFHLLIPLQQQTRSEGWVQVRSSGNVRERETISCCSRPDVGSRCTSSPNHLQLTPQVEYSKSMSVVCYNHSLCEVCFENISIACVCVSL